MVLNDSDEHVEYAGMYEYVNRQRGVEGESRRGTDGTIVE